MGLSCGATLFCWRRDWLLRSLRSLRLTPFPSACRRGKSPALCQREGTEGRECKYFSPAKLKPTFAEIGGGIDLAMLVATSHRKLFPLMGGFKRKEYVLEKDFFSVKGHPYK